MNATWWKPWNSRSPRERTVLGWLAVSACVLFYAWLLLAASQARVALRASVTSLQAQSARLEQHATEYQALSGAPAITPSPTSLRTLMEARVREGGLSAVLVSLEAPQANQVKVVFGAVPFADWLGWVVNLSAQQVRLESARIEALATPGMVSVTATFTRGRL